MNSYTYFVSFGLKNGGGGHITISTDEKINSPAAVNKLENALMQETDIEELWIVNWILLSS